MSGQQTTAELAIGSEFAGYRVEEVAARGGMGVVYRATQVRLTRTVALKLVTPVLARDAGFRERFRREWMIAASIDHPNVIPVYEAGEADGVLYIAMRWVEGSNLREAIDAGPLEPARAVHLITQVASALDAAHERDLIHRDVKPANILLTGEDHVYLTDFGLTKHASSISGLTRAGAVGGHGRLHGAGADRGSVRHRAHRHLLARLRPVRGAHRQAAAPARERAGDAVGAHVYGGAVGRRGRARRAGGIRRRRRSGRMAKDPAERYTSASESGARGAGVRWGRLLRLRRSRCSPAASSAWRIRLRRSPAPCPGRTAAAARSWSASPACS